MSLLIKALEQAAKDRTSQRVDAQNAPHRSPSVPERRDPSEGERRPAPLRFEKPLVERRPTPAGNVLAWMQSNPVMMFAALALLFGMGFGIYVYLQIAQTASATPMSTAAKTAAPAPQSALSPAHEETGAAEVAPPTNPPAAPVTQQSDAPATPEAQPTRKPIPISTVVAAAGATDAPPPAEPRTDRANTRKSTAAPRTASKAPQPSAVDEAREQIAVSPAALQSRINPDVSEGYAQLQAGNLGAARSGYSRAIEVEPLNIDALLGLAYIAVQENRSEEAIKTYLRVLQLNPRHAVAQAALIGLMGRADPAAAETRLKQLLAREPSAFLHFVLGNLYSDQSSWSQAQHAYFQAHRLEPDNPDYAYNLAIGLDHLAQRKLALEFYRRAEQLARLKGRFNFDLSNAQARIGSLSSQPQ
jgi:Tfp pilus assembly protein PilF